MDAVGTCQERIKQADRLDNSYLLSKADIVQGVFLGKGGFGIVCRGTCRGKDVAIKYLVPEGRDIPLRDLRDLKKEARRLHEASDHKHIIDFYGAVFEQGMNAIILEYMHFGNAAKFIKQYEVGLPLKMRIVCQICSAMNYLHSKVPPVKHLDLKADNVLIDKYFDAKLCDFGLSHLKTQTMTLELSRRGTYTHVAPEVLKDINVKPSTEQDVYAFAITTWEILSGKPTYGGRDTQTVIRCVESGQRPNLYALPDQVPQNICAMISNCWNQDPMQRPTFQNMYPDLKRLYIQTYEPDVLLACQNIRRQICDKFQEDPEHCQEDFECTTHFDHSPECDTARSITGDANSPLMDRDDHAVDAHPTLAMPALFNGNASLTDHQRVADHVEGIANLTIDDNQPQANIDDNVDVAQLTPTATAVPFGIMASADPDHSQQNIVPQRLGPVLDNTPVPAPRNTRPGVWSNLDETSLQLGNDYPMQRNTTDDIGMSILGQTMPNARVVQPDILGQPAPGPIIQPANLGQSAYRSRGQPGILGQPFYMSIGQPGTLGQPDYSHIGQPGNLGQPDYSPNGQSGILGQPPVLHRLERQFGNPGQSSVLHRLESTVSVDQHPTGRSNSQPNGTSERDHTGATIGGAATPLVISHKHAGGGFTQIEVSPNIIVPPNIQIGNNNKMVINDNGGRRKEKRKKSSSKKCDVNILTTSEAQLTQDQVDTVSAGLGKDWKTLCRLKLMLTDPEIEQLEHDYHVAGLYEITYQAIRRWQQKQGSAATQKKMALYLWEIERDDLAQQLK